MKVIKTCRKCLVTKTGEYFSKDKYKSDGLMSWCKECNNTKQRQRYAASPETSNVRRRKRYAAYKTSERATARKRLYGLSRSDFDKLFEAQGNACAVCGVTDPGKRDWHVDHCHNTGKVRGILCSSCNRGLGYLKDSVTLTQAAVNYLRRASQ